MYIAYFLGRQAYHSDPQTNLERIAPVQCISYKLGLELPQYISVPARRESNKYRMGLYERWSMRGSGLWRAVWRGSAASLCGEAVLRGDVARAGMVSTL